MHSSRLGTLSFCAAARYPLPVGLLIGRDQFDVLGKPNYHNDILEAKSEACTYDSLNRMLTSQVAGALSIRAC